MLVIALRKTVGQNKTFLFLCFLLLVNRLPTLQTAQGKHIHGIRMNINPEVSIGG